MPDQPNAAVSASPPVPHPRQMAWHELGFTGFIHFGPNTFTGREWGDGTEPAAVFQPTQLDAGQWVRAFKSAGARGIVVTAKHHDGWCAWPTKLSAHRVSASPWRGGKGDVLRELSDACRAEGMKFGVYLSPWDRNNPAYGSGEPYNEFFRGQLREVLTNYGPIFEVWFDGACGEGPDGRRQQYDWPSFVAVVRELQPDAVIFSDVGPDIRWVGNEQGHAGETCWGMLNAAGHGRGAENPPPTRSLYEGDALGTEWIPAECDVSIRPGWFYRASEDDKVKTAQQLFALYEQSAGRNANFHLNVPPDSRGLLHDNDVRALRELGGMIRATYGAESDLSAGAERRASEGQVQLLLKRPTQFDRVLIREDVARGQRIRAFVVEVQSRAPHDEAEPGAGAWREVARGTTVGIRRMVAVPPCTATALRVRVLDANGVPCIERVTLHAAPAGDVHR
ncbi:MAG: alpha-L-fucosidase [Phycisphaerae bacterium]|nr:alpha-L-fucosidase [Phycisphaerae bacterium]